MERHGRDHELNYVSGRAGADQPRLREKDMSRKADHTQPPKRGRERAGYVLITAMLVMMLMTVMGLAQLRSTTTNIVASGGEQSFRQAYYCAQAAMGIGIDYIRAAESMVQGCPEGTGPEGCSGVCAKDEKCTWPRFLSPEIEAKGLFQPLIYDSANPKAGGMSCQIRDPKKPGSFVTRLYIDPQDPNPSTGTLGNPRYVQRITAESAAASMPTARVALYTTFYTESLSQFVHFSDEEKTAGTWANPTLPTYPAIPGGLSGNVHTNDWTKGLSIPLGNKYGGRVTEVCPCGTNFTCSMYGKSCCGKSTSCAVDDAYTLQAPFGSFTNSSKQLPLPQRNHLVKVAAAALDTDLSSMPRADCTSGFGCVCEAGDTSHPACKPHSTFFGNTWVRFNRADDVRFKTPIAVSAASAFAFAAKFGAVTTKAPAPVGTVDQIGVTPLCGAYPACAAPTGLAPAATVGSPDFTGVILQVNQTWNFLENSLIGSTISGPGKSWVIVANDRDTLVLGATSLTDVPLDGTQLTIQHAPVTLFNADYNRTTQAPDYWGASGRTIASLINSVARAVNTGAGVLGVFPPNGNINKLPTVACALGMPLGAADANCVANRVDLTFGWRQYPLSTMPAAKWPGVSFIPELYNIGDLQLPNLGAGTKATWSVEGQGAAAGVNFAQAPESGLIGVLDMNNGAGCTPLESSLTGAATIPQDTRIGLPIAASDCGRDMADVRVWGTVDGQWSIITLRDIYVITNRSSLPVWSAQHKALVTNHDLTTLYPAGTSAENYTSVWKGGHLPVADSTTGPKDIWDQSKNIFGVVYAANPDPTEPLYNTYGLAPSPVFAACGTGTAWTATSTYTDSLPDAVASVPGCNLNNVAIPWRNYPVAGCAGHALGLFANQNVLLEDPSPQVASALTGDMARAESAWEVNVEALVFAGNVGLFNEHANSGTMPDNVTYKGYTDQYGQKGSSVTDRANYGLINGTAGVPTGLGGTFHLIGGVIQKYLGIHRGIVPGKGATGHNKDFKYDGCFLITGPPPYTPMIPMVGTQMDFVRMGRGLPLTANSL